MAHMIPSAGPADYEEFSHEGEIYASLKQLSDDFWVIHSFKFIDVKDGRIEESEADFIVFHPGLGIMCIEAKFGHARCVRGEWEYSSGAKMHKGRGPYRQADDMKWRVFGRFEQVGLEHLRDRCKLVHAVWFHGMQAHELGRIDYSPEAAREITLCRSDLKDPEPRIRMIFGLDVFGKETNLAADEAEEILHKVLCPEFDIVPTGAVDYSYSDFMFARLLESQARILDYLQDQRTAVINGAAGTGKTLIAIERARRASSDGRVLFLCFNRLLMEDVRRRCEADANIDVYNVSSLAAKICGSSTASFYDLSESLMDDENLFPYKHVIVDEGQDFGMDDIEGSELLKIMLDIVERREGSFYLFYDKRQFVQGSTIPSAISDADCKLTLYVNCRNTRNIAECSLKALGDASAARVRLSSEVGGPPRMFVSGDVASQTGYIDEQILAIGNSGLKDIVILTCKTIEKSAFRNVVRKSKGQYLWSGTKVPVYTCRTFKGLEADAVILVDVDQSLWRKPEKDYEAGAGLLFYTGASRAVHELRIVCDMGEEDCIEALGLLGVKGKRRPVVRLANALGATLG